MLNPRRVLPHSLIYDRVWGYDFGPTSNALRVYVGYLRRKLEDAGARPLIHTVRGVGYALREPDGAGGAMSLRARHGTRRRGGRRARGDRGRGLGLRRHSLGAPRPGRQLAAHAGLAAADRRSAAAAQGPSGGGRHGGTAPGGSGRSRSPAARRAATCRAPTRPGPGARPAARPSAARRACAQFIRRERHVRAGRAGLQRSRSDAADRSARAAAAAGSTSPT